jgi:uncharacterized membrane protein
MLALSGIYKFLLVLHLLAVIVGFGPTVMAAAYGAKAKARQGREGLAIAETTYDVISNYAVWPIYAVPILGILLVLTSDDAWKFSQTWISLSFLLYFVAIGIVHAIHQPNIRRMNQLMAELVAAGPPAGGAGGGPPPQVAEIEARGKRAGMVGGVLNLLLVVIVALMVWKPGV